MKEIVQHASYISITDYTLGECKKIERIFTYTENWTVHPVGIVYDQDTKELRIFGGADTKYIQYVTGLPIRNDLTHDIFKRINVKLRTSPKNELQKEIIQFLVGTGSYEGNRNEPQLSCNAETGEGKTFCAIAMIAFIQVKTMIIVNRENIRKNWYNEIMNFTDIDKRRICLIDKGDVIRDILDDKMDTDKYYVFIVVHRMIDNIAKDRGWTAIGTLFRKIGIGLKIYDEAHKEFFNTTFIDSYTNTWKTIYMTATPKLSSPKANFIYQNVFKRIPKFNQRELGYVDAKKHITMLLIRYNSHPSLDWIHRCYNARLKYFSAREHSMYQIRDDSYFFVIIEEIINSMVKKNGYRTLILVSRTKACDEIVEFVNHLGVYAKAYHSKIKPADKEIALRDAKVIVSTNQSLGLSETIKDLQFVLNAEAHRNFGDQASGRLRRFDDGRPCIYCELVDAGFKSISKQWNSRKKHYSQIFGKMLEMDKRGDINV